MSVGACGPRATADRARSAEILQAVRSSTTSRIYGSVAGADYRVSPDTSVGFALGGAGFNFTVFRWALGSGPRGSVPGRRLWPSSPSGAAYISGTFAYGLQDVTTDRTVTVSSADKLQANFKAQHVHRTRGGRLPLRRHGLRSAQHLTAAVRVSSFDLPGYRERAISGSDQFALSYNAQTTNQRPHRTRRARGQAVPDGQRAVHTQRTSRLGA